MLIEFSVSNFRSIRDRVTLSMVAKNSDKTLAENIIQGDDLPGLKNHKFLSAVAIYGANASGKSNILRAFEFMKSAVVDSFTEMKPTDLFLLIPYIFCSEATEKVSEFEIIFTSDDVRYQYGFSLTQERVYGEWLYSYPAGRERKVFEREYIPSKDEYTYSYGEDFGTERNLGKQTRTNTLLISVGAQFNHSITTKIYKWFTDEVFHLDLTIINAMAMDLTSMLFNSKSGSFRDHIEELILNADLGVHSLEVAEIPFDQSKKFNDIKNANFISDFDRSKFLEDMKKLPSYDVFLQHYCESSNNLYQMDLDEESEGTKRLFSMLGPIFASLAQGTVILIDEIEASLHPELTRAIIRLFATKNPNGAQLIFTTHDTTLLDSQNLLRRDQYWFTEKDREGVTNLIPLTDFKARKNEALQKGYLAGRYGAVPVLSGDLAPSE